MMQFTPSLKSGFKAALLGAGASIALSSGLALAQTVTPDQPLDQPQTIVIDSSTPLTNSSETGSTFNLQIQEQPVESLNEAAEGAENTVDPDAPISLFPSEDDEIFVEDNPQPMNPVVNETAGGVTILSEDSLAVIDPATSGLLGDHNGGLGIDMWAGSERAALNRVFDQMPERVSSSVLRNVAMRLLTTQAETPNYLGNDPEFDLVKDGISIIRQRVHKLAKLGYGEQARQLILAAGLTNDQIQDFTEILLEISLLENNIQQACNLVYSQSEKLSEVYWQQALIFCNLVEGKTDQAQFGVTMLQDLGEDDPLFYGLVDLLQGFSADLPAVTELSALQLAMFKAAKQPLPASILTPETSPAVLTAIATSDITDMGLRLQAAERAVSAGVMSGEVLAALYAAQPFTPEELQAPISALEEDYSARTRALLYQAAAIDTVPETRAVLIKTALDRAKISGHYQMTLAAYSLLISQIQITGDMWYFAADAARALYAMGRPKPAQAWVSHLSDYALRDPQAEKSLNELWALSRLGSAGDIPAIEEEAGRKAWAYYIQSSLGEGAEVEAMRRVALAYHLLSALQRPEVSQAAWQDLALKGSSFIAALPNPAHLHLLEKTALGGQTAEAVSWILQLAGATDLNRLSPDAIAKIVMALRLIGLPQDAQAFAWEVALANGF